MLLGWLSGALVLLASTTALAAERVESKNALSDLGASIREVSHRVAPSVVEILITGYVASDDEDGRTSNQISRQKSSGSGVILDSAGYIMTNAHVVKGAVKIQVLVGSATAPRTVQPVHAFEARVVGVDPESDLALLRIDAQGLPAIRFGNSDLLSQGDIVLAIGSPMQLRNSLTMGVVSAPARDASDDKPILYIQTDASINPGDSGGAPGKRRRTPGWY